MIILSFTDMFPH